MHIDEKTKVPLFAVLIAIPIIATWLWYMASVSHEVAQGKDKNGQQDVWIKEHVEEGNKIKQDLYKTLYDIDKRTIRIEEAIKKH